MRRQVVSAPKKVPRFQCQQCNTTHFKWHGKCPDCGAWNAVVELDAKEAVAQAVSTAQQRSGAIASPGGGPSGMILPAELQALPDVLPSAHLRAHSGELELDRVLGGGLVPGSLVLLTGDPGIGKSTLLLQALNGYAAAGKKVVYASGEESREQIKLRAERLGTLQKGILLANETVLEAVLAAVREAKPDILVIDSIQTVASAELNGTPGSVSQVRECTGKLLDFAKSTHTSTWIVGHVTKEGSVAGPKVLEHLVDAVLYLEGEATSGYRILRAVKNRFGSTGEIGIFSMGERGLQSVPDSGTCFLESQDGAVNIGAAVAVSMEGTRPFLVEIQALVARSAFAVPRRLATGFDLNRFSILMAVLEKRAGMFLSTLDAYATATGGVRLTEPAVDLALAAAIASSLMDRKLPPRSVYFGEVGLSGEVRSCPFVVERVAEAVRLGFERIHLPARSAEQERDRLRVLLQGKKVELVPVKQVHEIAADL